MASYFNLRRKIELAVLFFLVLFAFSAASAGYWIHWTFLASSWFFFVMLDFLFLSDATFIYDPNYQAWTVRAGYEKQ